MFTLVHIGEEEILEEKEETLGERREIWKVKWTLHRIRRTLICRLKP